MSSALQATLGKNFDQLAESFSSALTGGILNHVFEPIASDLTGEVVLKRRELTADYLLKTAKYTILHSIQSTDVLAVLPLAGQQKEYGRNHYLFGIVVAVLAILFSLGIWITLIVFPICFKKTRGNGKSISGTGYKVFAAVCLAFTLAGILLVIFSFIATGALTTSLNPAERDRPEPDRRVSEAVAMLVRQLPLFINEAIDSGVQQSHGAFKRVKNGFEEILNKTISGGITDLADAYNAKQVIDDARHLASDVVSTVRKIAAVYQLQTETIENVARFIRRISQQRRSLVNDLESICPRLRGDPGRICYQHLDNIRAMDLSFDISQIDTDSLRILNPINEFLQQHLPDIDNGTNAVDHLFDQLSNEIFTRIIRVVDLEHLDTIFDSFWDSLRKMVRGQLQYQLQQIQPQVKKYNKLAYIVVAAVGFTVLSLSLLLLLLGLVYAILCTLKSSNCQTYTPPPVVLTIVYAIVGFILLIGTVFALLVPALSWVHNDVCRYAVQPKGVGISDAALNLWLEYQWPRLLQSLAGNRANLIQNTPPQNILRAVTSLCRGSSSNGVNRGLLSLVGLREPVNATAIFQLPVITKAIQDNEQTIVRFVVSLNISSLIPENVEDLIELIRNLVNTFDKDDYTNTIHRVRNIVNANQLDQTLMQFNQFLGSIPPGRDKERMQKTVTSIRLLLSNDYRTLTAQVDRLIVQIQALDSMASIRPRFNSLTTGLLQVVAIAKDPVKLIAPIVPIYRKWTSSVVNAVTKQSRRILSHFVNGLIPCARLYRMTTTVLNVTCGSTGEVSLLGSFSTLTIANIVLVLITMLLTQIFVYMMPLQVI